MDLPLDDRTGAPRRWWFGSAVDEPRSRRAADVFRLLGAGFALAVLSALAAPPAGFERALRALLGAVPHGLGGLWRFAFDLLLALAIVVVASTLVSRRLALLRDVVVAGLGAVAVAVVIERTVGGSWTFARDALRLAVAGAVVITASPHLTRPARRLAHGILIAATIGVLLLGVTTPVATTIGILVAVATAAAVHLAFGSCRGRPTLDDVAAGLVELGVSAHSLVIGTRQPSGVFLVDAVDNDGTPLLVKFSGRDASDTQLLTTVWRKLWYREAGAPVSARRLQQVEHEAFATLLVERAGLLADHVVTAGATVDDDALVVLRLAGTPLEVTPGPWEPKQVWDLLERLHGLGVAHGQVDDRHLVTDGDRLGLTDFRGAAVAAGEQQLMTDRVQALVATALAVGTEPALTVAVEHIGTDGLADLLPLLQDSVVTPHQRASLRRHHLDLDTIRNDAAEVAGVETPKLQRLRRVTVGSLLQVVLLVVAFSVIAIAVANMDLANLWEQIIDARWWLVVVGLVLAQTPRPFQAIGSMGASPIPLPLAPMYVLQLALSYIGLAIPGSAARFAVNVRFFQRKGMPAGTAVAASALDSTFWFLVLGGLLGSMLVFTSASLDLDLGASTSSGLGRLVVLVVGLSLIALVVMLLVPGWRHAISSRLRQVLGDAREAARGLASPRRLAMLLGGNVAIAVLFAVSLGAFTAALGYPIGFMDLLFIHVSVALLAGIVPVPGGIGVVEAGLTYGLARAGMPEDTAFAAALLFRIATFYLPPAWGVFALKWLERNQHL